MLPPAQRTPDGDSKQSSKPDEMQYEYSDRDPVLCRLSSVRELRAEVRENMHNELTDVITSHTFVGIVDERRRIAAIQGGVKLYLVDYGLLCNEYFYQVGLTDFGNFGRIQFDPVLNMRDLLAIGAAQERDTKESAEDVDWEEVVDSVLEQLVTQRDMLLEYFSLEISEGGELLSLPLLIKDYMPSLTKLPQFLIRLGPYVTWTEEKPCFQSFLTELASFYVPESLPPPLEPSTEGEESVEEDSEIKARRAHVSTALENIIFPAFKARLIATKGLLKGVVEVANLKGLYRVFERC